MEYFVISAKFVPLKYYTLSSQLQRLTSFSVGCSGQRILSPGQIAAMRKWSIALTLELLAPKWQRQGPFILVVVVVHGNCVARLILYQLLSAASHRSITAFQDKTNLTFLGQPSAVTSAITISVQECAVTQHNCRCCYFQTPSVVHCMNATASAQSPKSLRNFYPQTIFANLCGQRASAVALLHPGNAQAQLHFRDDQQRAFGISNISNCGVV